MKKLLLFLLVLMATACSVPMGEDVGETQEAIGTCPRPTGGGGATVYPADAWVTAFEPDLANPWRIIVKSKLRSSPFTVTTSVLDFGGVSQVNSQAHVVGDGWESGAGRRLGDAIFIDSAFGSSYGCTKGTGWTCWVVYENTAMNVPFVLFETEDSYGSPAHRHSYWGGSTGGLTAVVGGGAAAPQTIKFYSDRGTSVAVQSIPVSGTKLDACAYP